MSIYIERGEDWVPYKGEPLNCARCGSRNTDRVKQPVSHRHHAQKRDVLICSDCGHITDRWKRLEVDQ